MWPETQSSLFYNYLNPRVGLLPWGPCTLNWHSQDIKSLGDHKVMTQKIPSLTHNLHNILNYYLIIWYNSIIPLNKLSRNL